MSRTPPPQDPFDAGRQSSHFVTGRLLAERYELLEQIGAGGTAEVFRANDRRLDRIVAIKVLRPQYGQDAEARTRFEVEARSAAALTDSNIVPVYDFGAADDGSLFIVMRFIDGPSLRQVISERGSLPVASAVEVGRQVAQALADAHDHGLVHRDVKPGNILFDAGGTAHLTDFGVVKALAGATDLTRTGMTFGTAAYLSPEQATGAPVGPRSDLYALGVVLYEALAGRPPFSGDDPMAVSYRHAHEAPTPLALLVPGIDADFERVVMQSLEKDPHHRPATAEDVAATLASIAARLGSTGPAAARLGPEPEELNGKTDEIPMVSPDAATASWSVPAAPVAAWHPSAPPAAPSSGAGYAPINHAGIAPPARRMSASNAKRRGGTAAGAAVVLLAIALVAVGTIVALNLLSRRDNGAVADASPTPRQGRTPRASVPAIVPGTSTPTESASALPVPPTAEPTLTPTTAPPPQGENVSAEIPDEWFVGDYDQRTRYHGRSASWVYGQGTPYHTMTANFQLSQAGRADRRASLQIVGLDGENPIKNRISIVFNGVTIYEGPNPLPDDHCCGASGPGNWGSAVFEFPGDLIGLDNSLTISNLEPGDCRSCPKYVMVDYAVLEYRARP